MAMIGKRNTNLLKSSSQKLKIRLEYYCSSLYLCKVRIKTPQKDWLLYDYNAPEMAPEKRKKKFVYKS